MEFLYSDEGQNIWLKGYCHPIRYADMNARGVIPADLAARLPKTDAPIAFPSIDQIAASKQLITDQWMSVVGADVK
jgi:putative spermidine/putrescine transport system substrate-binding protein